jgi:hypothetical protein
LAPKKLNELTVAVELQAAQKAMAPAVKRLARALATVAPDRLKSLPVGALADTLYDLRGLNKQLSVLLAPFTDLTEPAIKAIEEFFVDSLRVGEASGVQGMRSRVQVTESVIPVAEDWAKFYKYLKRTGEFELLNRAINRPAVAERWDAKKQVPGVGKFVAKKVSCTKLGGKK